LVASVATVIALSIICLAVYQAGQVEALSLASHQEVAMNLGASVAQMIEDGSGDARLDLERDLHHIVDASPIDAVSILDRDGHPLAHVIRRGASDPAAGRSSHSRTNVRDDPYAAIEFAPMFRLGGKGFGRRPTTLEARYPIGSELPRGWVVIRQDLRDTNILWQEALIRTLQSGLFCLGACVLALVLLIRRPLRELDDATRFIGDLDRNSGTAFREAHSTEELERLSRAINRASSRLSDQHRALQASEAKNRSLVENLNEVVFQTDRYGRWSYLNPSWKAVTGLEPSDCIGKSFRTFIHPDDRPQSAELYHSIAKHGQAQQQIRCLTKNGDVRWLDVRARPLYDECGSLAAITGTLEDITERLAAERRLNDHLQLTQKLLDAIPTPIFYRSVEGKFLVVNSAYADLFGYPPEHYIGKTAHEAMSANSSTSHVLADAQILDTGTSIRYETELIALGGQLRHALCTKAPLRGTDDGLAGIVGVFSDISDQKAAAQQISKASAFLHHLVDALPNPLFVKDRAHRFVLVNDAWLRLNNRTREATIDRTDYEIFDPEEAGVRIERDAAAFATNEPLETEERITEADGIVHTVLTRVSAFSTSADERFVVSVLSDISEIGRARARMEDQLRFTSELIEALPFPLYVKDRGGAYVMMNRATEEYMRLGRQDCLGKTEDDIESPAVAAIHRAMEQKVLQQQQAVNYTTQTYAADGSLRHSIITKGVFTDASGAVAGIIGTIHDITERKRIENRLHIQYQIAQILADAESIEEAIHRILHVIGDTMGYTVGTFWQVDSTGNSLACTDLWCANETDQQRLETLGRSLRFAKGDGLAGRAWQTGEPLRVRNIPCDSTLSQLRSGFALPIKIATDVIAVMHFFGGRKSEAEADVIAMLQAAGSQIGLFIERQRTARTLRASEALARKLSLVASNTHNAVIITDTYGSVEWVNSAFTKITGYTSDEICGIKPGLLLQGRDTDPAVIQHMREKIAEQQGFHVEVVNYRKSGEMYWVSIDSQPVLSDSGELTNFIAVEADITDRKLGEALLIETTTRLNLAIEGSNLALWDWPISTGTVYLSETWSLILGKPRAGTAASVAELRRLVHPDDRHRMIEALAATLRGQTPSYRVSFRIRSVSGQWRWCQCHGQVVDRNADGWALRMAGTLSDVTEHYNAEQALRVSEERLNLAINASNDGIWDLNLVENIGYISPRYAALLNLDFVSEAAVLDTWLSRIHPEDRTSADQALARHLEADTPLDVQYRMSTQGTDYRWFRVRGRALRDANGTPVRITGSISDITEYCLSQELLHETRDRLESILHSTEHMIWSRSTDSQTILYVNPAVRQIYGREPEEFQHSPQLWRETIHPDDRALVLAASNDLLRTKGASLEFRVQRPDGSIAWVSERSRVARNTAGRPIRIDAITADITKLKMREIELRQAKEAAEAATNAKSEFVANMSHEIRTPMNGIIGMTDLMLTTELTAEQRDQLEVVRSSSGALLELINDILDFSKIEAGKLGFENTEFLLRDTLADTMKMLAVKAEEKGLEFMWRVNSDVPDILIGDPLRLRQVVTNLLGNAIKFTSEGEVELCVGISEPVTSEVKLLFAIRDTGIGISYDKTASIFHAFSQADMSVTRRFGGSGLGLAISERLVSMMGGNISLKSDPGKGTTFYFSAVLGKASDDVVPPADARKSISGLKVLVYDDSPAQLVCLVETLSAWQIQCTALHDLDEAIAELQREAAAGAPFDLAILDGKVPGLGEGELIRKIRSSAERKDLPLLLLTPITWHHKRMQGQAGGPVIHLSKASSHSELQHAIAATVGRAVPEAAAPSDHTQSLLPRSTRSLRVLLVEDNEINIRFALGVLQRLDYRVTIAHNGIEALQAFNASSDTPFDLALMDVQMPIMSGLEATGAIRVLEQGTGRHLPIIAMTANAMRGDRERCIESGMDDYLPKPIEIPKLLAAIKRAADPGLETPAGPSSSGKQSGRGSSRDVPPVYDRNVILETLNGDHEAFRELAQMLFVDHKGLLEAAASALRDEDAPRLSDASHTLKGMIGNFAAKKASSAAQALYKAAHTGDLPKAHRALQRLRRETVALERALRMDPVLAGHELPVQQVAAESQ
jgi:PAS domain S-box-containing protein